MLKFSIVAAVSVALPIGLKSLADLATAYCEEGHGLHPLIAICAAALLGGLVVAGVLVMSMTDREEVNDAR